MSHGFNEARVKVAHPYLTMMGLYLGGFTGMFSETCLNIALPQLGVAFDVDTAITQWLVIGYMLVIGLVMPFASILMKWFSVRKLHAVFAWRVYRRFARERLCPHVRGAVVWATGARHRHGSDSSHDVLYGARGVSSL